MRLLSRYIIKEMIGPTLLGFGFYTFVILMQSLFSFAEMIIKRSLPFSTVLRLLGLSLPHIIVLTIPMSLLFGILIAVGRLSSDSEIIAMRSAGLPTSAIYKPVFLFSAFVFLINLYLMNFVTPGGNAALQRLKMEQFASPSIASFLKPRVFFNNFEGRVIYVNDVDPDGKWRGVFISDTNDPSQERIIVAKRGELNTLSQPTQLWLSLQSAELHASSQAKPDRYDRNRNASQRFLLVDRGNEKRQLRYAPTYRELDLFQLLRERQKPLHPTDRRMVDVEIHKKFSIPFACVAFGIIALPLGITNRRGGKSSGFSLSIGLILVYYLAITNGEDLARSGTLPPFIAMWGANVLLAAVGAYLIRRANTDAGTIGGQPGRFSFLFEKLARLLPRRRKASEAGAHVQDESTSLLSRLDIPFPNTLDRYVLREFLKILVLVILSTAVLFIIVDYTELAGEISENDVAFDVVISYYRYFFLQIMTWVLPLSVMLGTLVTFGVFSKNNEITAIKANGVSLYRLSLPIIAIGGLVSLISYLLLDFVQPYSNERMAALKNKIKGRETVSTYSEDEQRQWLFGEGRHLFNFLSYDRNKQELSEVQVFEFAPTEFKLTRRIYARTAKWDGSGWWFSGGWIRSFDDSGGSSYTPILKPIRLQYREQPEYFATEVRSPNQMTYAELSRYVANLRRSGYSSDELRVKLYQKTSEPFIALIMTLIALPFAFRVGKRGALYGVGLALALAFTYWAIFGMFTKFGEVGNLPALMSAWSANILFAIAAVYMFVHVET